MENSNYMSIFLVEAREHLESLNDNLIYLDKNLDDLQVINEVFRSIHTVKGMAGSMGFKMMAQLTHATENVLDQVRNGRLRLTSQIIDMLFQCYDYLDEYLKDIESTGEEEQRDLTELNTSLMELIKKESKDFIKADEPGFTDIKIPIDSFQAEMIKSSIKSGYNAFQVNIELVSDCILKSARAYIVFKELETLGEIVAAYPIVEEIEDGRFDRAFALIVVTASPVENIRYILGQISELESVKIIPVSPLDMDKALEPVTNLKSAVSGRKEKGINNTSKSGRSIRVDIDRLDSLMNLVSELIIVKNRIQGTDIVKEDNEFLESIEYLGKVAADLHDAVMQVRMVPVDIVFNRFPRVTRDLSKETGKEIELIINGANTEIDRTIVDELSDPLLHIIRNSVDHGIESPEERLAASKSKKGTVTLSAHHEGNNVVIRVSDDGGGIDTQKVIKRMISNGEVDEESVQGMSEEDILSFIFHPGFSTAAKVSNISGRGVGLDVVKTKIEALGGIVEVKSVKGKGTSFIIRLPLTLSIIRALLVKVMDETYALPLGSIVEVIEAEPHEISYLSKKEVLRFRDSLIPLIRLGRLFADSASDQKNDNDIIAVIIRRGDSHYALAVDSLIGQQEVVIKSLGSYLSDIKFVSGATILGDGNVALILDVNHITIGGV